VTGSCKRRLVLLGAALVLTACGARTSLDVSGQPESDGGPDAMTGALCSLGRGPVDASAPGDFTGRCPPAFPYCVIPPMFAAYACCPSPHPSKDDCFAPKP
jgi:hypothetical protein